MARHPWVTAGNGRVRWGVQLVVGTDALSELVATGRLVDEMGYDGVFIFDHPAIHADPWICLSALAAATDRVSLGSAVNCVGYRHPAYLARLAADLDNISNGRIILGLGIGWLVPEFAAFDIPFKSAKERFTAFAEALEIIPGVWGPEPFSFDGQHYRVEKLQIQPPPLQAPRPPLMIGGSGERVTLRFVAKYADACNVSNNVNIDGRVQDGGGATLVKERLEALRRHCDEVGRPTDEVLKTHFTIKLAIAPTDSAVAAKLEQQAARASTSPGTRRTLPSAFVTGTPDQVAAFYQSVANVGIEYFIVQVDSADHETLELLATEVMPRVEMRGAGA
jgi:alkanesulfonate monooxygenase SsuD/methylene tetrahydromethanopterin reductase-like flavin-dependent oxidoreductase (luciferase family)